MPAVSFAEGSEAAGILFAQPSGLEHSTRVISAGEKRV